MAHPALKNSLTFLPPLTSGQKAIFVLGTGVFAYQVLADVIHNFAQERFERWGIHPKSAAGALTLGGVAVLAFSSPSWVVYFCFVVTGILAFAIYRSPLTLGAPPPSGLLDMVAEAGSHPEWEYCLPHETLVSLIETALKHPDKQSLVLVGDSKIGKTLQIEHLAWMLKNQKLPQSSPIAKIRIFRWDDNKATDLGELLRFFKNHPDAFLFIDTQPRKLLTFYNVQAAMQRGELRLIGTATSKEYAEIFAPSDVVEGLWHQLQVNEPTSEQCMKILEIKTHLLTQKYGPLTLTKEALETAILLSKLIWPKLKQPASAFDFLNRACPHLVGNSPTTSAAMPVKIDAQDLLQAAIKAQLINQDFDIAQLQKGEPVPSGLVDMEAEAGSHPEWKYCLSHEALLHLLETTLSHPDKQSIMLVGDPGTGKTLQIEHLAWMLKNQKLPKSSPIAKIRIFRWDKYNPPKKIEEVLQFFKDNPHAHLFIDKNHKFANDSSYSDKFDNNQTLTPAMQRGELRLIATATPKEYTEHFAPTDILDRLWHQLPMSEPTKEQCIKILEIKLPLLIKEYGNFTITGEALLTVVALSKMIWPKLKHPDSAFDLLNRLCSWATKNLSPPSSAGVVAIDTPEILQGAKNAQLIEKEFDETQLQLVLNPSKQALATSVQDLLPSGLTDMVTEVESHPEWAYGANADLLIPKIVMAQAESWKKSILLFGHSTNTTLLIQNLCWRIKNKKLPQIKNLENVKILKLNPNQLMDDGDHGSKKKKGIKQTIEYLANRPNTICIVENASFLVKGSSFFSDKDRRSTLAIKEALSDGKLRLIGTISTLNKDNNILIDKDDAIQTEKLWIIHQVPELTLLQCAELLLQAKEDIARRYSGIKIDEEAIKTAAILAEAYRSTKSLWESAYDIVCQGCTQELLSKHSDHTLIKEDLIKVVLHQKMTNDPQEKLRELVNKKLERGLLNTGDDDDGVL